MGAILDMARNDFARFATKGGFEVDVNLKATNDTEANVKGIASKIYAGVDTDGQLMKGAKVHVTFIEADLPDYPLRNSGGEVDLERHIITLKFANGVDQKFMVSESYPDETIGNITCILGDYDE